MTVFEMQSAGIYIIGQHVSKPYLQTRDCHYTKENGEPIRVTYQFNQVFPNDFLNCTLSKFRVLDQQYCNEEPLKPK